MTVHHSAARLLAPCVLALVGIAPGCKGSFGPEPLRPNGVDCAQPTPSAAPLRRLTPEQYRASVASVVPGVELGELDLVGSSLESGFDNDVRGQGVSALLVEQLDVNAQTVASAAAAETGWLPCTDDTDACARTVALEVGARAYRRPLAEDEADDLSAFMERERASRGLVPAAAMLVEALLQTPQFLYLPEVGDPSREAPLGTVALTDHELAVRLSYFLWNEPPDSTLREAAAAGELTAPEQLEAHARRMLEDPRAARTIDRFVRQWLHLERLHSAELDESLYPELTPETRDDLERSLLAFARHAFGQPGGLSALYTDRTGFVNDRLAPFFGVSPPGSEELVPVELPDDERAGVLTQPALLTSTSHGLTHSPILRGVLVLDSVLCVPPPPPPPEILAAIEDPPEGSGVVTTRQKIEQTHGTNECSHCHEAIDGMGFTFEAYDALGRYRTHEHGEPVDTSGQLRGMPVENALDLADRLAGARDVEACFATQWFRFALARQERGADACQVDALADQLRASDGDLRELVVALATSPSFRFRPAD
ncbi:MAG TPA: DUF1592 domain-containing protein [Sandaracinaceae bacterium LLY-WYZ-13_1]|nr:DUF1592 domain-containing protein [Sandaracinaceae bacterium LLY-WYZ-13_1]